MKIKLLLLFAFLSLSCIAQFSKTHYIPPISCSNNLANDQYIYISTPSIENVNFKIIANGVTILSEKVKSDENK